MPPVTTYLSASVSGLKPWAPYAANPTEVAPDTAAILLKIKALICSRVFHEHLSKFLIRNMHRLVMAASIAIGVVGGVGGTSYLATSCKHSVRNTIQGFFSYKKTM